MYNWINEVIFREVKAMKRSVLFVSLLLSLILSNPASNSVMASTADPFSVQSGVEAAVNKEAAEKEKEEVAAAPEEAPTEEVKPQTVTEIKVHTVVAGDSLWRIAQKLLGDGNRYREIVEANKAKYPSIEKNPDLIYAGWVLEVPVEKEVAPAPEQKPEEPEVKTPEIKIETDSSVSAEKVAQLPQWSTEEKVKRLQNALDSANRALLAQKQRIADLNEHTVRFLIDNKFMTEEDWMAMNPPEGYAYRLDRTGKVELVGADNKPLTNAEMKELDSKAKEVAPAAEKKPGIVAIDNDKSLADADAKSKQEAHEKAQAEAKKKAEEKAAADKKLKEDKAAADKKVAEEKAAAEKKAAEEKAAAEKAAAEAEKLAETRYQKMLNEIGAPDFADNREDYFKGVRNGTKLLTKNIFTNTPFYKFADPLSYPAYDIPSLQRDLREAQKNYEKAVDKNKTSKVLGVFGSTIESAGKKVEQSRARLEKAWGEMEKALDEAKAKGKELETSVGNNKTKVASIQKELDKLDRYDSKNAHQVQKLSKEIKEINEQIKDDEKKLANYHELKSAFKL